MSTEGTTSGTYLLSLQTYVTGLAPEGFERVLRRLPPAHADLLRGIIMPQRRYPTQVLLAALEAAHAEFGPDFPEAYGEWGAHYAIHALFRFLLKFKTPSWVLGRATRMWRTYHDTGEWDVELADRSFRGVLRDFCGTSTTYCRYLQTWMATAGRMTGAHGVQISHPQCRAAGGAACVFVGSWGEAP